jgi:hypothetical protein
LVLLKRLNQQPPPQKQQCQETKGKMIEMNKK